MSRSLVGRWRSTGCGWCRWWRNAATNVFNHVPSWQVERFFDITYVLEYLGAEFTVQVRAGNYVGFSPWTAKQTFTAPATSSTTSASSTTSTSTTAA